MWDRAIVKESKNKKNATLATFFQEKYIKLFKDAF